MVQFESVLKGHGFSRAASRVFIAAFAAEGQQFSNCTTSGSMEDICRERRG
jgi:hypothetical protein